MFSNRTRHDRKIANVLMPLYTRVMKETVRLTDYLHTVEGANNTTANETEAAQFADLYLRKLLAELESPNSFFRVKGAGQYDLVPRRKGLSHNTSEVARNLHSLYERISIDDLQAFHANSQHSRLYNNLNYYRLALQIAANSLEGTDGPNADAGSARKIIKRRMRGLRVKSEKLIALPPVVLDQYNEKQYLLANMDVRAAMAEGSVTCGLEHFAMQGVQEAKKGGRPAPGVELDLIKSDLLKHDKGELETCMRVLESSGMFDAQWYQKEYGRSKNPLLEYCQKGASEGRRPNALFDQEWYCKKYPDVIADQVLPAFHYAEYGESEQRQPCESFTPAWYREVYKVEDGTLALVHYLTEGKSRNLSPSAFFDSEFYLANNPDVVKAAMDPVDHYYRFGWKEKREPTEHFNVLAYIDKHMGGDDSLNPVTHAIQYKLASTNITMEAIQTEVEAQPESVTDRDLPSLSTVAGNIRYFANPGPDFEGPSAVDVASIKPQAKTVAFYLPQYHAFEDNDKWWGEGFSEWRNVSRGTPRYAGHYQPRIPRDLGFYDLNDTDVMRRQATMALENGIEAFCFYYYWFNGKRLMDMPLDNYAAAEDITQEFCIMWANENWTRTWDGFDSEVLIAQDYHDEDEDAFIEDTARYFKNKRYMRVNGRPLFILYRPGLLPEGKSAFKRWRTKWKKLIGVEPYMLMVQGFGDEDPRDFNFDGAVEFPPHKVCADIPNMHDQLNILDTEYEGYAKAYTDVIARSLGEKAPSFPLIKTVVPHWDNDARREGRGFTMHGSTPALYESWLQGAIKHAQANPFEDEPLVFINAWNEWAEGAYLEPDVHYGHAYLNATKRAVHGLTSSRERQKLLLVGHDAYRHGAQMLLHSLAKTYQQQFGIDVTILLRDSGPMISEYEAICRTVVLDKLGRKNLEGWLRHEGFDIAVSNTTVTGDIVPILKKAGLDVVSLIHELPNLIEEYKLENRVQTIAEESDHVIFASKIVRDGFRQFSTENQDRHIINPQGIYKSIEFDAEKRLKIRSELGITPEEKVVLNVGYADLRKGFDIFLQMARLLVAERADVHFVWAGKISDDMKLWVQSDLDSALQKRIHLIGFTDKMADYYCACDALFLSSREDPYPSVVLEAMCVGAPVVVFKGATGFDELMSEYGHVVDKNEVSQISRALVHSLYNDAKSEKQARQNYVEEHCQFDDYCFDLLQLLRPDIKKISVVVPNYNYEEYMPARLGSVFEQTYPVFETIVLDDCSTDNSAEVIEAFAEEANRVIRFMPASENGGNVFKAWTKGLEKSRGDMVWIAEADDLSHSEFLAKSQASFNEETVMSFCDSVQIGTDDEELAKSYDYYYRLVDSELFSNDFRLEGVDFIKRAMAVRNVIMNVSSVLWDADSLRYAMKTVGTDLYEDKLVGDWHLYLTLLAKKGASVAYIAESLNTHRRHQSSVTHSLDEDRHLQEIESMHALVCQLTDADTMLVEAMSAYIEELNIQFKRSKPQQKAAA